MKVVISLFCAFLFVFQAHSQTSSLDAKLMEAVKNKEFKKVKKFLKKGANPNCTDENGATPVMWSLYKNDTSMTKFLVSKGANPKQKTGIIYITADKSGYYGSCLAIAVGKRYFDMVKYLVEECKVDVNEKEFSVDGKPENGWTPLQYACIANVEDLFSGENLEMVKFLLENGANPNLCDAKTQKTPLSYAITNQRWEIAKYLSKNGADVNLPDVDKNYPLHLVGTKNIKLVISMIKNGANLNVQNAEGLTPLMIAAANNDLDYVRLYFTAGADISVRNNANKTAAEIAKDSKNHDVHSFLRSPVNDLVVMILLGKDDEVEKVISKGDFIPNKKYIQGFSLLHAAAVFSKETFIKPLLAKGEDLNNVDDFGQTPLMKAAENGNLEIVQLLIENKADVNKSTLASQRSNRVGWTALHFAAMSGENKVIKELVNDSAKINATTENGYTALSVAAANDKLLTVKLLYYLEADTSIRDNEKMSALDHAKKEKSQRIVDFLNNPEITVFDKLSLEYTKDVISDVSKGKVDPNAKDADEWSLLHFAVLQKEYDLIDVLVEKNANVNATIPQNGLTPLHFAALTANYRIMKILLMNKANPNAASKEKMTATMLAARKNSKSCLELLHIFGANLNSKNANDKTALDLAVINESSDAVDFLKKPYRDVFSLVDCNFQDEVIEIIEKDNSWVKKTDESGYTLLHRAAMAGGLKLMEKLIAKGANVNAVTTEGYSPVVAAVVRQQPEAVILLLRKGADANTVLIQGLTLLHLYAARDNIDVVKVLIEKGANVNAADDEKRTPLMLAANSGNTTILKYLVYKNADVSLKDKEEKTASDYALRKFQLGAMNFLYNPKITIFDKVAFKMEKEVIDEVKQNRTLIAERTSYQSTLLHYAAFYNFTNLTETLLSLGADINAREKNGETVLHNAFSNGSLEVAKLLLRNNADVSAVDSTGWNILHYAARNGKLQMAQLAFDKKVSIDSKTKESYTPLIIAVTNNHFEVVKFLVEKGANTKVKNEKGKTAFEIAKEKNNQRIVDFLKNYKK